MTDEEYLNVQTQVLVLSGLVVEMDLEGLVERISRVEAAMSALGVLPLGEVADKRETVGQLAVALLAFQKRVREVLGK
jgi:hypothetical protein